VILSPRRPFLNLAGATHSARSVLNFGRVQSERLDVSYHRYKYSMEGQTLDTVDSEKDLSIMISSDLKSSSQCIRLAEKLVKCLE